MQINIFEKKIQIKKKQMKLKLKLLIFTLNQFKILKSNLTFFSLHSNLCNSCPYITPLSGADKASSAGKRGVGSKRDRE